MHQSAYPFPAYNTCSDNRHVFAIYFLFPRKQSAVGNRSSLSNLWQCHQAGGKFLLGCVVRLTFDAQTDPPVWLFCLPNWTAVQTPHCSVRRFCVGRLKDTLRAWSGMKPFHLDLNSVPRNVLWGERHSLSGSACWKQEHAFTATASTSAMLLHSCWFNIFPCSKYLMVSQYQIVIFALKSIAIYQRYIFTEAYKCFSCSNNS